MAHRDDENRLEEELAKRWDPEKLSRFLKLREGKSERLDLTTRERYERRFGVDLGDVRVFTGALADEITTAHNAEALTVADTKMVLLGSSSRYARGTAAGEALLAHELTHVAQSKPSQIHRKSVSDAPLATEESEREAEAVEAEVHAEQAGEKPIDADKDEQQREKHERVLKRVLELFEEDALLSVHRGVGL